MKTDWQGLFDRMERIDERGMTMEFLEYQYPYFFAETPEIVFYPPMYRKEINPEPPHKPLHQIMEEGSKAVDKMYDDMVTNIFNGNFYKLNLSENEASEAAIRLALKGKQFKSLLIDETHSTLATTPDHLSNLSIDFGLNRIRHSAPEFSKPKEPNHKTGVACDFISPSMELYLKQLNNNKPIMKQKFLKNQMISIASPRGVTVAILAEDFNYEKPCMTPVEVILLHDGTLAVGVDLYIHQDVTNVRLADEKEGTRLFRAMKVAGVLRVEEKKEKNEAPPVPKDGEIRENERGYICIFDGKKTAYFDSFHAWMDDNNTLNFTVTSGIRGSEFHDVSLGGMKRLIEALAKKNLAWNPTLKRIENKMWRAKEGEYYWCSICDNNDGDVEYKPYRSEELGDLFCDSVYAQGDYHRTEQECQAVCNELNAVLAKVKESKIAIK